MSPAAAGAIKPVPSPLTGRERDRRFLAIMAGIAIVSVFAGFARTYFLAPLFDSPPLSPLLHAHAAISTAWVLLFVAQIGLVAAHRTDLHRRLGVAGVGVAIALLTIGYVNAITSARLGIKPPGAPPPDVFLAVSIVTLLIFALLVGLALYYRRQSDTHKRLMLLATITMLGPAFARLRYLGPGGPTFAIGGMGLCYLACIVYDRMVHGRVHPVFLWGGSLLIVTLPLRFFVIGRTTAWRTLAAWLLA